MPTISTVVDGVTYVLVPNADCAECAFLGREYPCSMKKVANELKFGGVIILCHLLKGAWKKAEVH